jgi:hypothetical protein
LGADFIRDRGRSRCGYGEYAPGYVSEPCKWPTSDALRHHHHLTKPDSLMSIDVYSEDQSGYIDQTRAERLDSKNERHPTCQVSSSIRRESINQTVIGILHPAIN